MHNDKELLELAKRFVEEAEENAAKNPSTPDIQVVIVEPMKKPYKKTIPNEHEVFQRIVGGYTENVTIGITDTGVNIAIVINEQGKIKKLSLNRRIINHKMKVVDFLVGTFFLTAYNLQGGNVSLSDEEAAKLIKKFSPIEIYF
jgi:hypothetical protein